MYQALSNHEEYLAAQIVDIAITIHKQLGPGLLESVYEKCFCYELAQRNIPFKRQEALPIFYKDFKIDDGLRIDILIDDLVIVELKAQELYHPVWDAQLLSYLKLSNLRLGFLINFHTPLMKDGIKRKIV
jgi:GxxExxY protein